MNNVVFNVMGLKMKEKNTELRDPNILLTVKVFKKTDQM